MPIVSRWSAGLQTSTVAHSSRECASELVDVAVRAIAALVLLLALATVV